MHLRICIANNTRLKFLLYLLIGLQWLAVTSSIANSQALYTHKSNNSYILETLSRIIFLRKLGYSINSFSSNKLCDRSSLEELSKYIRQGNFSSVVHIQSDYLAGSCKVLVPGSISIKGRQHSLSVFSPKPCHEMDAIFKKIDVAELTRRIFYVDVSPEAMNDFYGPDVILPKLKQVQANWLDGKLKCQDLEPYKIKISWHEE